MEKTCNHCSNKEDSFAMELLRGYKRQFYTTVLILSAIIFALTGYIIYDAYVDSQFETIEYTQDGNGYNNINTGVQGDVLNGSESAN